MPSFFMPKRAATRLLTSISKKALGLVSAGALPPLTSAA
ncbi:hypothetical protein GGR95_002110 [Sulfitobacter undariae]|uniref:Uncharacterized protein n=1 Tax=Sulfitobacter undariae TaxID=1563671 RepID=A0A7W6E5A0_9RHOB|nr:hypothetical protein [Sulfitobacter undariae]